MADNATIPSNRVLPGRQGASGVSAMTTVGQANRISKFRSLPG
jgi:hypothetical protein